MLRLHKCCGLLVRAFEAEKWYLYNLPLYLHGWFRNYHQPPQSVEFAHHPEHSPLVFFRAVPKIYDPCLTLAEVGLGYVKLGQSATTLSGGEAQRIKLAAELSRKATGQTLYILDEPTTGLHFHDVAKLLEVLFKLRGTGNTLVIIEHNLDVIKTADWIIDLGPEGGSGGGRIVAQGTPETVARVAESYTGQFLSRILAIVPLKKIA